MAVIDSEVTPFSFNLAGSHAEQTLLLDEMRMELAQQLLRRMELLADASKDEP